MALMKVCAIYDQKAESFGLPMAFTSIGVGLRDYSDHYTKDEMRKHRADYDFYHLGDYDTSSGLLTAVTPPKLVFKGCDLEV